MKGLDAYPEIFGILKEPGDDYTIGSAWHTDQMFSPHPAKATLLLAKETPNAGEDTLFANMHLAYHTLSDAMKNMLSGVKIFSASHHFKRTQAEVAPHDKAASRVTRKWRLKCEALTNHRPARHILSFVRILRPEKSRSI
jgi:alpha-ketoglutarate-dependent taurine dioxygenase